MILRRAHALLNILDVKARLKGKRTGILSLDYRSHDYMQSCEDVRAQRRTAMGEKNQNYISTAGC